MSAQDLDFSEDQTAEHEHRVSAALLIAAQINARAHDMIHEAGEGTHEASGGK